MRARFLLAVLLAVAVLAACAPTPAGPEESQAAPSAPPADQPEASATPYSVPNY